MAVPETTIWDRDPHTEAKHRVIAGYFDAWFPIMTSTFPSLTVFEGYAGPGTYEKGEDGSPLIALQRLVDRQELLNGNKAVRFVFIESRKDRLDVLQATVAERFPQLPHGITVGFSHGGCEERWEQSLTSAGSWGMPIFANLDPFGPGVPYRLVERLGQNKSSEVLVTFMSDWLRRFATLTDIDAGDVQFGTTDWRKVAELGDPEEKELFLVEEYRRTLSRAGFMLTSPFKLTDEGGHAFYLIFGTGHRRGLERMKDSMWRTDPVQGLSFRDPRDPNQGILDFGNPEPDLSPLVAILSTRLESAGVGGLTIGELKDFAVLSTGFRAPHVTRAVQVILGRGTATRDPIRGQLTKQVRIRLREPNYALASRPTF
ncbi:MAG: three-Cys-motif partner protein TcmP [Acidimicrobiia bacterium]|nr:three-Cys-motif partner protein TcmP [Acidimicrobiia bacterium]MDQ3499754.1 three-Cys-motif partner protein TcmP [Actinomycetota bacterium]